MPLSKHPSYMSVPFILAVEPFRSELVSETVLQRLIRMNIITNVKFNASDPMCPSNYIYQANKPCDFFVLILQGRVEVDIGREHMKFEGGPFMFFGAQALTGKWIKKNAAKKWWSVTICVFSRVRFFSKVSKLN